MARIWWPLIFLTNAYIPSLTAVFGRAAVANEQYRLFHLEHLRTATWRAKKRHGFLKNLSTKLPKPAPLKKRHLFFAFLLRWSAVADSGVIFSALSSTPVPHGFEAKSKHRAENFLLLLYRNIQSQKVNTASKSFLKSPLFLYRNIERKIFNINFKNAANAPHSLTATSEAKKRHQFLKFPRKFTN